ncbi:hypothetical protein BOSE21B_100160 [Bosea sp. 21B]|nr:hypothetical protein BOSE21B_100160 [Bosea sp. 21B]CAD5285794.1 hypothetical protein BOSE7B_41369 [Bosea sp. 7B]VXC93571.1 hypothetical protein BOSE127_80155 [Bosea sp. 127]
MVIGSSWSGRTMTGEGCSVVPERYGPDRRLAERFNQLAI